jgi:DNA invertase Pin-like site-specific DNA recombinase
MKGEKQVTIYQNNSKISTQHLDRKAIVYLRQSSERQVRHNTESKRLQYALVDRAKEFGWKQLEIIDSDLGSSASIGSADRQGFDRLIASVARGEVGIVLSREVSRLSRTDKDWCQLLEVCQIFGTLIGDAEQIYDLSLLDDQLILGIKGTMSVVELKVLRMRLLAGMEEKARRGEMLRLPPAGYVKDGKVKVVKDPDKRVQEAIDMVFRKFRELWSIRQTFLWFHTQGIELPVNKSIGGRIRIVWQLPTYAFIKDVLTNAFYAGAYVWGRRQTEKVVKEGKVVSRIGKILQPEECRVFIPDHHEGYIDWERFQENRTMITGNSLNLNKDESVTVVRGGQGFLVGILRCGRCGRKLHVRYWGKSGTAARYVCKGDFDAGGKYCLAFGGSTVDRRFSEEILKVLSPLGVRASLEAMKRLNSENNDQRGAMERQIQQMQYEVKRAFEQYNEVDPRNRLVAGELERRWNEKLEELGNLKSSLSEIDQEVKVLSDEERKSILQLGENFQEVWESEHCSAETKKKIIRTVVEEVIVNLNDSGEMLHFIIHWKGGSHTQFEMLRPKSGVGQKTSLEDLQIIRRMGVRYGDDEIARVLNKLGRRTGKGKRWSEQRVRTVRYRYSIPGQKRSRPDPEILTLGRAARYCNVSQATIKRLVANGVLKKKQVCPWAPWEIKRSDLDSEPIASILDRLRRTGKLVLKGDHSGVQQLLFQ